VEGAGRVSRTEFLVFNQELATLLKAGMPLVQSLDILRQRVSNATFKAVLDDVYERVKAGAALSEAFAEHGDLFPRSMPPRSWRASGAETSTP
jgi:type IV pilus assembly protein PilC